MNPKTFKKGNIPHNFEDLVGRRFGKLKVIGGPLARTRSKRSRVNLWRVECDCGKQFEIATGSLKARKGKNGCFICSRKRGKDHHLFTGGGLHSAFRKQKGRAISERNLTWTLSFDDFSKEVMRPCHYCGIPPSRPTRDGKYLMNTLDRVDSKVGYNRTNVVPCCLECNLAKGRMGEQDFIVWINRMSKLAAGF